jgi:hypothetical protein
MWREWRAEGSPGNPKSIKFNLDSSYFLTSFIIESRWATSSTGVTLL